MHETNSLNCKSSRRDVLKAVSIGTSFLFVPPILVKTASASVIKKIDDLPGITGSVYPNNVGYANTVSSGADNGANDCDARFLWNSMRHSTTEQAINNILGRLTGPGINCCFAGHGNKGLLETGAGQNGPFDYKTNVLYSWNYNYWGPMLERVAGKNMVMLDIISCNTGAGNDGADLLFEMAKRTKTPIRAQTGLTYCGSDRGIFFEPGSVWQVATPDQRPTPIEPPSQHFTVSGVSTVTLPISSSELLEIAPDEISQVLVEAATGSPTKRSSDPDVTRLLILSAFGGGAFRIPGPPLGMTTAKIAVQVRGRPDMLRFSVINDRLIVADFARVAFHPAPSFADLLKITIDTGVSP